MRMNFGLGLLLGAALTLGGVAMGRRLPEPPGPGPLDLLIPPAGAAKPATSATAAPGGLLASFGVGGVLTRDGELWQYRPDRGKWITLDESFGLEGKRTKLIPLPVAADQIKQMETFGFLITRDDQCWLYDLDRNEWTRIGAPPFHQR